MTQVQSTDSDVSAYRFANIIAFLYGIVAYFAFFVTVLYAIGFVMGFAVPKTSIPALKRPSSRR